MLSKVVVPDDTLRMVLKSVSLPKLSQHTDGYGNRIILLVIISEVENAFKCVLAMEVFTFAHYLCIFFFFF